MDLRYERLRYFRRVSRKEGRGIIYHDPWHRWGCYRQPREDRYKNIDRTTIRRLFGQLADFLGGCRF